MPNQTETPDWFERIPKAELHLHLEGAIPHKLLWRLIEKYGGDPAVPTANALEERLQYVDFAHFIETWKWKNQYLREYEDFTAIAEAMALDLRAQNIRYAEVFYGPANFVQRGLQIQELTSAIRLGLDSVPQVRVSLVADLVRDHGADAANRTLASIAEVHDDGVVGIGIGGSEQKFPPELFTDVFTAARRHGFRTSAHAGEAAGAQSVWGAIRSLNVERIGHGTRAEEDPGLIDYLAEHKIPLEMCPLSNVCTGVTERLEDSPIRRYVDRGLVVTVNTDDPKMFGNSLAEEYRLLHQRLGFNRDEIRHLVLEGVRSSWLTSEEKQHYLASFVADDAWLDAD